MSDDAHELESLLRAGLRDLALSKGPCPPVERIAQYQAHELPQEAEAEIHAHVVACPHCEMLLLRIEGFVASILEPQSSWRAVVQFLRRPVLGYALAAVLLLALLATVGQRHAVAPATGPVTVAETLPSFELPETRGESDVVVHPQGSESFILRFFVPMASDGHYVGGIRDQAGREVVAGVEVHDSDGRGNVEVLCRTKAFTAGSYLLTILEIGSPHQFQYSFRVQ